MTAESLTFRFYQQVCSNLHMFFLVGDDQAQKQLPSTLFLRLLQLTTASVDHYEPWDQASLVRIAQYHLEDAQSLPRDDGESLSLCSYHSPQSASESYSPGWSLPSSRSSPPSPCFLTDIFYFPSFLSPLQSYKARLKLYPFQAL